MRLPLIIPLLCAPVAAQELQLPARDADALGGMAVMQELLDVTRDEREARLWEEFSSGNVPEFMRTMRAVMTAIRISDEVRRASFFVTPDVLCVGSDGDFVRTPMTPQLAQRIADEAGCLLITRRMSDLIWDRAEVQLVPQPFTPSLYDITSPEVFLASHWAIEAQRDGHPLGELVAGIKKDVVISAGIADRPDNVFIYGWHEASGEAIQPLYGGHVNWWVDYSHGIRLVSQSMRVDGESISTEAVLADPALSALLSDEGPISDPRYPIQ